MGLGKTTKTKGSMPGVVRQTRSGTLPSGAKYQVNRFKYPEGGTYTAAHASKSVPGKSHTMVDRQTYTSPAGDTKKGTTVKKTVRKLGAKAVTEKVHDMKGAKTETTTISKGRKAKSYGKINDGHTTTAFNYESTPREKKKAMTAVKRMDFNQAKKRGK